MATIPHIDVRAQYAPFLTEIRARIDEVLDSGVFILGPNVKAFEAEAAAHLGVADSIGVANGTDAISLVLDALDIGAGDEVICRPSPSTRPPSRSRRPARRPCSPISTRRR